MWWSAKTHSNDNFEDSIPIVYSCVGNTIDLGTIVTIRSDTVTSENSLHTFGTS